MNITSATFPCIVTLPMPKAAVQATDGPTLEASETPGRVKASREAGPALDMASLAYQCRSSAEECPISDEELYLWKLKASSQIELEIQQCHHSKIRNELNIVRPDLANKPFSYTLGADGQLKILDPNQSLNEGELNYLTELFNAHNGFKDSVIRHAEIAIALVHNDEVFGGQYELNLGNIENTLDYGKLIAAKPEKRYEAFVMQVLEKGEKREQPLVDVMV